MMWYYLNVQFQGQRVNVFEGNIRSYCPAIRSFFNILKAVFTADACDVVIYTRSHNFTSIETMHIYICPKISEAYPAARERFCNSYREAVCNVECSILEGFASRKTINVFTAVGSYNHTHHNLTSPEAQPVGSAHCPVTPNEIAQMGGAWLSIAEGIVLPTPDTFSSKSARTSANKTTESSTCTNICALFSRSSRLGSTVSLLAPFKWAQYLATCWGEWCCLLVWREGGCPWFLRQLLSQSRQLL